MARITKEQLLARIDAAETAAAEAIRREEAAKAELATALEFISEMRASASRQPTMPLSAYPIVVMGGRRCYKVRRMEHGRMVTTYKPVEVQQ